MHRYGRRLHDRELERRHIEALDEPRDNVRSARRDYQTSKLATKLLAQHPC